MSETLSEDQAWLPRYYDVYPAMATKVRDRFPDRAGRAASSASRRRRTGRTRTGSSSGPGCWPASSARRSSRTSPTPAACCGSTARSRTACSSAGWTTAGSRTRSGTWTTCCRSTSAGSWTSAASSTTTRDEPGTFSDEDPGGAVRARPDGPRTRCSTSARRCRSRPSGRRATRPAAATRAASARAAGPAAWRRRTDPGCRGRDRTGWPRLMPRPAAVRAEVAPSWPSRSGSPTAAGLTAEVGADRTVQLVHPRRQRPSARPGQRRPGPARRPTQHHRRVGPLAYRGPHRPHRPGPGHTVALRVSDQARLSTDDDGVLEMRRGLAHDLAEAAAAIDRAPDVDLLTGTPPAGGWAGPRPRPALRPRPRPAGRDRRPARRPRRTRPCSRSGRHGAAPPARPPGRTRRPRRRPRRRRRPPASPPPPGAGPAADRAAQLDRGGRRVRIDHAGPAPADRAGPSWLARAKLAAGAGRAARRAAAGRFGAAACRGRPADRRSGARAVRSRRAGAPGPARVPGWPPGSRCTSRPRRRPGTGGGRPRPRWRRRPTRWCGPRWPPAPRSGCSTPAWSSCVCPARTGAGGAVRRGRPGRAPGGAGPDRPGHGRAPAERPLPGGDTAAGGDHLDHRHGAARPAGTCRPGSAALPASASAGPLTVADHQAVAALREAVRQVRTSAGVGPAGGDPGAVRAGRRPAARHPAGRRGLGPAAAADGRSDALVADLQELVDGVPAGRDRVPWWSGRRARGVG